MGSLIPLSRELKPAKVERLPSGCFSVHRGGEIVGSTLPGHFPHEKMAEIGQVVLEIFRSAQTASLLLAELRIHYSGLQISAREMRGGALIFLTPATLLLPQRLNSPAMHYKTFDEFILHLENYVECWKQFNHFLVVARAKKFSPEDDAQFLEREPENENKRGQRQPLDTAQLRGDVRLRRGINGLEEAFTEDSVINDRPVNEPTEARRAVNLPAPFSRARRPEKNQMLETQH